MDPATTLVERIAASQAKRIAILGLTRGAGKATTLNHLMRGLQERGFTIGIVAAGREEEDAEFTQTPRGMHLAVRPGTVVATTAAAVSRASAKLDVIEPMGVETPQGELLVVRITEEGEVEPVGPTSAHDLRAVVESVERHAAGRVLIEGSFNRRSFAAPGIADGIVLAVGAAIAPELERAVAGARYYLDLFSLPACDARAAELYPIAEAEGAATMIGAGNTVLGGIPWRQGAVSARLLLSQHLEGFRRLVVPRSLGDDFVIPLLREKLRFEIIVRDPMRLALSPVYYNAWQKLGGGITVVHPTKVLALSLNPTNPAGPDQDAEDFLQTFRKGMPDVPSHDVIMEEIAAQPKRRWFGIVGAGS
jgi:hypothetical protein